MMRLWLWLPAALPFALFSAAGASRLPRQTHPETQPPRGATRAQESSDSSWGRWLAHRAAVRHRDRIPEVRHYKVPLGGYTRASPLYARQRMWEVTEEAPSRPPASAPEAGGAEQERQGVAVPPALRAPRTQRDQVQPLPPSDITPSDITSDISDIMPSVPVLNPPVSACIQCIVYLTCLFFVVYIILFVLQTPGCVGLPPWEREEKAFLGIVETVHFVPMLCVLIMATRIRAVQLTQGRPDHYGLPQWWVKVAMQVCTWSVLALTLFALVLSQVNSEVLEAVTQQRDRGTVILRLARNAIILSIYLSFTVICIGACIMEAPPEMPARLDGEPRDVAALSCTLLLAVLYFGMYLVRTSAMFANRAGLLGQARRFGNAQELLRNATGTVAFAPMLGVLFIAARMRIFQIDREEKAEHFWLPACCWLCAGSVLLQTALITAHYFLARAQDRNAELLQDEAAVPKHAGATKIIERARSVAMACLYVGVVGVTAAVVLMRPVGGTREDMPVSLACVVVLAGLYFGVYFVIWVLQVGRGSSAPSSLEDYLHDCKVQVAFCPMFSVLFLATLLRALLLTGGAGSPQAWCEVSQQVATAAIVLLMAVRFDVLLPSPIPKLALACAALQYACLFVLYVSAIVCVFALVTMTSESAGQSAHSFGKWLQVLQTGWHSMADRLALDGVPPLRAP